MQRLSNSLEIIYDSYYYLQGENNSPFKRIQFSLPFETLNIIFTLICVAFKRFMVCYSPERQ